ncbi:hypothetical protein HAX54_042296 [Datura stramonium]|uniref:Uncharacterized protein n=1 Tax=Datura stramonium TaxID=4076 RepID=A0ABS8SM85_DATST|nr:hypothetical protein [Datura stramonium]
MAWKVPILVKHFPSLSTPKNDSALTDSFLIRVNDTKTLSIRNFNENLMEDNRVDISMFGWTSTLDFDSHLDPTTTARDPTSTTLTERLDTRPLHPALLAPETRSPHPIEMRDLTSTSIENRRLTSIHD